MSFLKNMFLVAVIALFAVGCSNQGGKSQDYSAQVAVSDAGFASLQKLDWAGYAAQVEPNDVAKFRATLMPGIEKMVLASKTDSINLFGKNFNSQEIQDLDPDSFFVEIMNMVSEVSPEIKTTFSNMTNKTIGAVAESDSLVHVVIKTSMMIGPRAIDEMNIQSVVNTDGSWKLRMSPKIDGIAMMLAQAFPR